MALTAMVLLNLFVIMSYIICKQNPQICFVCVVLPTRICSIPGLSPFVSFTNKRLIFIKGPELCFTINIPKYSINSLRIFNIVEILNGLSSQLLVRFLQLSIKITNHLIPYKCMHIFHHINLKKYDMDDNYCRLINRP